MAVPQLIVTTYMTSVVGLDLTGSDRYSSEAVKDGTYSCTQWIDALGMMSLQ